MLKKLLDLGSHTLLILSFLFFSLWVVDVSVFGHGASEFLTLSVFSFVLGVGQKLKKHLEPLKEIERREISVPKMVRTVKTEAQKLGDEETVKWAENELGGWQDSLDDIPSYRKDVKLAVFNEYSGQTELANNLVDESEVPDSVSSNIDGIKNCVDRGDPAQLGRSRENVVIIETTDLQRVVNGVEQECVDWARANSSPFKYHYKWLTD